MIARRDLLVGAMALAASALAGAQTNPGASGPRKPRIALVLGSGAARGFAHIGVIKALEEARIKPDLIVGSSAGALVGAFAAAGFTAAQMEEIALRTRDVEVLDFQEGSKRGLVLGDSLQRLVDAAMRGRPIEQLPTPFVAVATQLRTGDLVPIRRGSVGLAVRASSSIPGVFIPARVNDMDLVDGGLVSPVPVRVAREAGADIVIAVDVSSAPLEANPSGIFEQVMQSFEIMSRALAKAESEQADIVIRPEVARIPSANFGARATFIELGHAAGRRFVPVIQERLAQWGRGGPMPKRKSG